MSSKCEKSPIVMVGAFPPPVHGMASINLAVSEDLKRSGVEVKIINLAPRSLNRRISARLGRLPIAVRGLNRFSQLKRVSGQAFYMSISGGLGQVYELLFVIFARQKNMRIFLHHHSFSYIDKFNWLTSLLCRVAGSKAIHATQSPVMGDGLKRKYCIGRTIAISNAVFLVNVESQHVSPRSRMRTLGFLSNLSAEKGVFEFLELMTLAKRRQVPLEGILAGPFDNERTEQLVRERLTGLPNVRYVGAKYGAEKEIFYKNIDAFAFPTRYAHETEGIVTHEAMSRGIPVLAYGRGCIPEIVGADCGAVIHPDQSFPVNALAQLERWIGDPVEFERTSRIAAARFAKTYSDNRIRWKTLKEELLSSGSELC